MIPTRVACLVWFAACVFGCANAQSATDAAATPARPTEEAEATARLEAIRRDQRSVAAEREAAQAGIGDATRAIREADLALADAARELRAIEREVARRETRLATLDAQRTSIERRLESQRAAIAALLRSAYLLGRDDALKLVFAPDELGDAARLLAYHRYLKRDRVRRIERLVADLAELGRVRGSIEAEAAALDRDRAERLARRTALDAERGRQRGALAALEATLADRAARLAALGRDERELLTLLERLRDAIADIPKQLAGAEPFATRRGALPWPVRGEVLAPYGSTAPDGRVREGVLVAAEPGASVAAVAHGRVAYADWLKGYGLIAIVEHGDGWMSLYAHNESLLRDVGEWVAAGEPLATAGKSGGSEATGVYFELRHAGAPVDPTRWLAPKR